jgi:hypothetical protein
MYGLGFGGGVISLLLPFFSSLDSELLGGILTWSFFVIVFDY